MSPQNNLIINKSKPLIGNLKIPGDKSISHRSIILGALSNGELTISNFLTSDDCNATVNAMRELGADISINDKPILSSSKTALAAPSITSLGRTAGPALKLCFFISIFKVQISKVQTN